MPLEPLDQPYSQAQRLFYRMCWPKEFQARLEAAPIQSAEYAQVVSDYIDYFIETEK